MVHAKLGFQYSICISLRFSGRNEFDPLDECPSARKNSKTGLPAGRSAAESGFCVPALGSLISTLYDVIYVISLFNIATSSNARVTSSDALVTSSFVLLVVMPLNILMIYIYTYGTPPNVYLF